MANFDDMKLAVQALTGGKNTVLLDDLGMPSIMVAWPKLKLSELFTGGSDTVHPGSIVNNVEKTMYVGKYQSIVVNSRAYSLPGQDPKANITFDTALTNCRNKGSGWGLVPYSLWAQIALWCRKNGTMPRGNNNYGKDHSYTHEKGIGTTFDGAITLHTATGSGPATWNHNWLPDGIADLNGNVSEWCAGLRTVDGKIQVIPYANCMDPEVSLAAASTAWKEISAAGAYVDPGTEGTLKYDWLNSKITLISGSVTYTTDESKNTGFTSLGLEEDLTVPELAKALALYPTELGGDYGGDLRYINFTGERLPYCGGSCNSPGTAGVFCVNLSYPRSISGGLGFRSAFCAL